MTDRRLPASPSLFTRSDYAAMDFAVVLAFIVAIAGFAWAIAAAT